MSTFLDASVHDSSHGVSYCVGWCDFVTRYNRLPDGYDVVTCTLACWPEYCYGGFSLILVCNTYSSSPLRMQYYRIAVEPREALIASESKWLQETKVDVVKPTPTFIPH